MTSTKLVKQVLYPRDADGHYVCEKCGFKPNATKSFPKGNPATMHYHMKKHTKDFPYECLICKCGFAQKQTLQNHMKARHPDHFKEKDHMFKCPIEGCGYESITKGNCVTHCARRHYYEVVENHLEISTSDSKKIYQCACCTKPFKSAPAYYHHILKCLVTFDLLDSKPIETLL